MLLQSAHADTLFRPRAVLGYAAYDLTTGASDRASSNYTTLGVGATLARDQFYVDAIVANTLNARYDNHDTNTVEDFSRQDVTLTVGMLLENLSVFSGYKTGHTHYSTLAPGASSTFNTDGLFVGALLAFPLGNNLLTLNAALASMNGHWKLNSTSLPINAKADTLGMSLGMAYTLYLSDTHGFLFKGAYQSYHFKDWNDSSATIPDIDETIVSVDAGYFVNF